MRAEVHKTIMGGLRLLLLMAGLSVGCVAVGVEESFARDSSVIEKVTVNFKDKFGEPEEIPEPEITVSGSDVSIADVQYSTEHRYWKPGKKVRIEISLSAEGGKIFPDKLNRSECKVSGAEFVSARSLDIHTLQVKVDYRPIMTLGVTSEAGWSDSSETKAVWKSVEHAPGYSVVLYGDDKVVKRLNVKTTNVGLGEYMKDPDRTYYYEVKAVPLTSDEKKWLKEGSFVTSDDVVVDVEDESPRHSAGDGGERKGTSYVYPDGQLARNTWKKLDNSWYYYNADGAMCRGWVLVNGSWFYMGQDGRMQTGWVSPDGGWYYLDTDGSMRTGWLQTRPGEWYYLDASGRMAVGWTFINGKWYFLDENGRMKTGWLKLDQSWYYLNPDGSMAENTVVDGWSIGAGGVAVPAP